MAWTNLLASVFGVNKPIKGSTILNLYNNIIALANGDAGAPQVKTAAIADASITNNKIAEETIGWTKFRKGDLRETVIADGAISNRTLIKRLNTLQSVELTSGQTYTPPGGLYMANMIAAGATTTAYIELYDFNTKQWLGANVLYYDGGTPRAWAGVIYTDGVNVRVRNVSGATVTFRFMRMA